MARERRENVGLHAFLQDYKQTIQHSWLLNKIRSQWVFEDVQFDSARTEQLYHEHRLGTIRANWKFILLMFKLMFSVFVTCNQFSEDSITDATRFAPFLMLSLLFLFKYYIGKSKFLARNGAIVFILIFGILITRINLEIVQFRLFEGFILHLSVSFLMSTCLISDWRVSSAAILLIYSNLYTMLKLHYEEVPRTVFYALASSSIIFCFNSFLISRNFKQEFISTSNAKQASSQLKKILEGLPEGVTITNELSENLEFVNKKLKQTFDVSSFSTSSQENVDLAHIKQSMDDLFDDIYARATSTSLSPEDSQSFVHNIFNKFIIKIKKDKIEEGKGEDPDVHVQEHEEILLSDFLKEERLLCRNFRHNERSTKVSIAWDRKGSCSDVECLDRDFIVKTSQIDVINDREKHTFLQMFIDTTQITLLGEEKAKNNYQRQMLSNVSHEFRTPLNAMSLSLELMKPNLNESLARFHKIASSSCVILQVLIEDILDLSKIEAGVFEIKESEFTFGQLFDEVNSIFGIQTRMKGVNLNFKMESVFQELKVRSDKDRLKQILLNLISNALKFTDDGSININLKVQEMRRFRRHRMDEDDSSDILTPEILDEMPVLNLLLATDNYKFSPSSSRFEKLPVQIETPGRILQKKPDEPLHTDFTKELKVELSVTDTGIGISEKDLPSLFKLFGKTSSNHNRNKGGTGLGLTICKKLCEKLGGRICLRSKEGVGTKVICSFVCYY
ncbi:unnamed protein product [Moneuplotes crassus]|uniref:histidine kinase n=1 Tax=Euplotes crassus TaxID=5936 RepID=A0AAD1Y7B9_EUPCR|nr:unnamed protein product [Moneuplotes crassus]